MKIRIFGLLIILSLVSCSVEKANLSPVSNIVSDISSSRDFSKSFESSTHIIKYSSEITNSFSQIPSFSKKEINDEISNLKFYISEYIYAIKEYNTVGKEKALFNYEKSYKRIQKLKNKLPLTEQDILNRFLVNIKTNMSLLESQKK